MDYNITPEQIDEMIKYFDHCGGVPFDHWGKGCPADCQISQHIDYKTDDGA